MRLRNKNTAPTRGGWWFTLEHTSGSKRIPDKGSSASLVALVRLVQAARRNLGMENLDDLAIQHDVEDQICGRVSPDQCWSQGYGDKIHKAIRTVARAADKAMGTELDKKATGCSACKRRRQRMNKKGK